MSVQSVILKMLDDLLYDEDWGTRDTVLLDLDREIDKRRQPCYNWETREVEEP